MRTTTSLAERCRQREIPRVLSIAGSDSGGGAGIQADLKAFAACRVHGMTAITAITAQNTVGVDAIQAISPEMILAQVRAVARDIGVDAVKVGMLGSTETIDAVAEALAELRADNPALPIVVDPVMVSETRRGAVAAGGTERADHADPADRDGRHPEPARGASLDGRRRATSTRRSSPVTSTRSGRGSSSSPAVTERSRPMSTTTANGWSRSPASATPPTHRTARGARIRRCSRHGSRTATIR